MQTNLNMLFQGFICDFAHLLSPEPQTKKEFMDNVKKSYCLSSGKIKLFYQSIEQSQFNTIQLNQSKTAILFN